MDMRPIFNKRAFLRSLKNRKRDGWTQSTGENIEEITGELPMARGADASPLSLFWSINQYPSYMVKCNIGDVKETGSQVIPHELFDFDGAAAKVAKKLRKTVIQQSSVEYAHEEKERLCREQLYALKFRHAVQSAKLERRKAREQEFAERIVPYIKEGVEGRVIDYETEERMKALIFGRYALSNMQDKTVKELRDHGHLSYNEENPNISEKFYPWLEMQILEGEYFSDWFSDRLLDGFVERSLVKRRQDCEIPSKVKERDVFDMLPFL